jgi:hypothetical protein
MFALTTHWPWDEAAGILAGELKLDGPMTSTDAT